MAVPSPEFESSSPNAEALASFVCDLDFDDLPTDVVDYAKTVIIDTIGCIVGGVHAEPAQPVLAVIAELAGRPEASILGTGQKTGCVDASFCNSYLSDVLDFEDTLVSHPSAGAVPAGLAVAERVGASGRQLITSVVAAYEVGVRVQRAVMPTYQRRQEVQTEYGWKSYPAVVAAAILLGLSPAAMLDAFGYAGRCGPVPGRSDIRSRPLPWIKANYAGQTSTGVFAALLAARGFRAPRDLLDGEGGYSRIMGSDVWRPGELLRGLGTTWVINETNLKPYPCCRLIHPVLDAIEVLKREYGVTADDVVKVHVRTFGNLVDHFADYRPAGMIDAEFSAPYAAALTLLRVPPGPEWYAEEQLRGSRVRQVADLVSLELDDRADAINRAERRYTATVEIELSDGTRVSSHADRPRGGPSEPLSTDEVKDKFVSLASVPLEAGRARQAYDDLTELELVEDVRTLTATFNPVDR